MLNIGFLNEIAVALFHRSPPVREPFIGTPTQQHGSPDTGHKFLRINHWGRVNLAENLEGTSF